MREVGYHIPSLEEDAEYAAAVGRKAALQGQLHDVLERSRDLHMQREGALAAARNPGSLAQRVLDGGVSIENLHTLAPDEGDLFREVGRLQKQEQVLRQAIRLADNRILQARGAASRRICAELESTYRDMVRNIAEPLIRAMDAVVSLQALVSELEDKSIGWTSTFRPQTVGFLACRDRYSRASYFLRDALDYGLLERSDIPAEWLDTWEGKKTEWQLLRERRCALQALETSLR